MENVTLMVHRVATRVTRELTTLESLPATEAWKPINPTLRFLWHPGTRDMFSGYGLVLGPAHLVGLVMIDRPEPADPAWLATIHSAFGDYQLTVMTTSGERGIVCQMLVAKESTPYLCVLPHPHIGTLRDALLPLIRDLPAITLALAWHPARRCWVSEIRQDTIPV